MTSVEVCRWRGWGAVCVLICPNCPNWAGRFGGQWWWSGRSSGSSCDTRSVGCITGHNGNVIRQFPRFKGSRRNGCASDVSPLWLATRETVKRTHRRRIVRFVGVHCRFWCTFNVSLTVILYSQRVLYCVDHLHRWKKHLANFSNFKKLLTYQENISVELHRGTICNLVEHFKADLHQVIVDTVVYWFSQLYQKLITKLNLYTIPR